MATVDKYGEVTSNAQEMVDMSKWLMENHPEMMLKPWREGLKLWMEHNEMIQK